jgi:hypothetical protein
MIQSPESLVNNPNRSTWRPTGQTTRRREADRMGMLEADLLNACFAMKSH